MKSLHFKYDNYNTTVTGSPEIVEKVFRLLRKQFELKKVSNGVMKETYSNGKEELIINL